MSLLNTKKLPALAGMREVTIKSFKEIENDKGGYIETVLLLPDREYKYCIFPSQVDYVTSTLANQLGKSDVEITLGEVLKLAQTTPIKVWFTYNTDLGRMNVAFHESKTVAQEEALDI